MHRLSHLAALLLFTAALACSSGHDSTSPTHASITGTWTLQTVNGAPLPFTIQVNDTLKSEVLAASYQMLATSPSSGSFSYAETDLDTVGASVTTFHAAVHGIFTLNDTTVTFTDTAGGGAIMYTYIGFWSGNTLTTSATTIEVGFPWVYTRK